MNNVKLKLLLSLTAVASISCSYGSAYLSSINHWGAIPMGIHAIVTGFVSLGLLIGIASDEF